MSQNIFSVEGLISWLEMQPGETEYIYTDGQDCLMCRYLRTRGLDVRRVDPNGWHDNNGEFHLFPGATHEDLSDNPLDSIAVGVGGKLNTYAAALKRARAMVAS